MQINVKNIYDRLMILLQNQVVRLYYVWFQIEIINVELTDISALMLR